MASPSSKFQSRIEVLCPAYLQFLAEHETDALISNVVVLYGQNSIEERNTAHEVVEYLLDYVSIGNDSGDYEFLLKRDGSETVVWEDPGCFSAPSMETIHSSFPRWLAEGCPLPEASPCPIPIGGRISLLSAPPGGMKDMFVIKKVLASNWSIPEMRQSLANLPALLIDNGMPYAVHRGLLEDSAFRSLLGFSWLGSDTIHRYEDFDPNNGMPLPRL